MLKNILVTSALFFFGTQALANDPSLAVSEMQLYAEKNGGSFLVGVQPEGYTAQIAATVGERPETVQKRVDEINKERREQWVDYVNNSGEYDHLDAAAKQNLIDNPADEWGSPEPLLYEGTYIIYKNGERIGYVIEFADMVDSTIIQDGSGWVFFLDADQETLVKVDDWQA